MKRNHSVPSIVTGLIAAVAAATAGAQDADQGGLEEIVVTAQKRAENLQTTPIAITALSAKTIAELGIANNKDLFGVIPNVQGFEPPSSRGNLSINIRGIPSGNANSVSNDPASAFYVDGVFVAKGFGVGLDVVDLERIEVLRGPQGTLYGRNTTGGAVNFVSRQPSGDFRLDAQVGAGNYGLRNYRLSLDLPTAGALSSSFTYFKRERDPLYGNTNSNLKGSENLDREGWRVALVLKPSESFTASYNYTHSELAEFSQGLKVFGLTPTAAAVASTPGYPTNVALTSTSRSATLAAIQNNLAFLGPAAQTPQVRQLSQWITDYRAWEASMYKAGLGRPDNVSGDIPLFSSNDVDAHGITLSWRRDGLGALGDVEFKSITGFRDAKNLNQGDLDGVDGTMRPLGNGLNTGVVHDLVLATIGGLFFNSVSPAIPGAVEFAVGQGIVDAINTLGRAPSFSNYANTEFESFQQELSMVGRSGNVDYAAGLFYYTDEGKFRNNRWALFPISASDTTSHDNETKSTAVYGQMTWRPSDESPLAVTAGLRHTKETKDVTYLWRSSANASGFFGFFFAGQPLSRAYVADSAAETQAPVNGIFGKAFSKDFSNTSGKLTLGYDFNDDVYGFVTYSTGYKSGTYNGDFYDSVNNTGDLLLPEEITNIEAGIKADLNPRLRLNASLFHYDYEDMHINSLFVRPNGSVVSRIQNAGRAKRYGGEVELTARPIDTLTIALAWAGVKGTFDDYPVVRNATTSIANTVDFATRGLAPDNQLTANVDWQIAATELGKLSLNLNANHQGETFPLALSSDSYASGPVIFAQAPNNERTLVNARLSLSEVKMGSSKLRVSLWGRNLTDEDYREFSFNYGASLGLNVAQYGEPRTYGVDFSVLMGE
ncbi:MAG: TonB-dependent receptor [Gammaproteobacteria bacterium]|nr:TonB-dependent receptor [Gammaproteobacteria bacterium]